MTEIGALTSINAMTQRRSFFEKYTTLFSKEHYSVVTGQPTARERHPLPAKDVTPPLTESLTYMKVLCKPNETTHAILL